MKKAFDQNVSRARPRLRLDAFTEALEAAAEALSPVEGEETKVEGEETTVENESAPIAPPPPPNLGHPPDPHPPRRLRAVGEILPAALGPDRLASLQADLQKMKALNLALTQDLEAARRQAEIASEEARLRMEESRRVTAEMQGRARLLDMLEQELSSLEAEYDEAVMVEELCARQQPLDLRRSLAKPGASLGKRKQIFLNLKGGTGKTSLSTSYAFRLAELGHSVLLVDLDSQGHATKCLGYEGENFPRTLVDVLVRKTPLRDVIQHSLIPNLDFVPSNLGMSTVDLSLMPMSGREFRLRNAFEAVEGRYDLVVFDAPPSFGLLNLNALMACDDLIVPVRADFLSFHGLKLLFETVRGLEDDLAHALEHIFIVINGFNASFKLATETAEALREHYPEFLLSTIVRQCTKFAEASSEGLPVFLAYPDCKGAQDIDAFVAECWARINRTAPERAGSARRAS